MTQPTPSQHPQALRHGPPRLAGATLALLLAAGFTGCGGGPGAGTMGGGGGSTSTLATPPADPGYYNLPSTPLGAVVDGGSVTFHYWNPTAQSVSVPLYNNWNDRLTAPASTIALAKDSYGVWSSPAVPLTGSSFYVYNVNNTYQLDPYAKSMAQWVNSGSTIISGDPVGKGAIVDTTQLTPDGGWSSASAFFDGSAMKGRNGTSQAPYRYLSNRDAIIYEAGIRDLTVDPSLAGFASGHPWGTYKGLIDLLPHIQKLGVTHVQLLCPLENYTYDQTRIGTREMNPAQTQGANYNWGYDPQNYCTPTGMYSAAPNDPSARINELKTLINEIHKQGMGVIIDVVYNHTANNRVLAADSGLLNYYYRASSKNGAGSQDVKSENLMTRKLIVDSIYQWVNEYHADGFRFDLMGVLDYQTLNTAYSAAQALNPKVIFLGEGWTGDYTGAATDANGLPTGGADQSNAAQFTGRNIAMFSDSYRNIFKNGYPSDGSPAFLSNQAMDAGQLFKNIAGQPTNRDLTTKALSFTPGSSNGVVNYLTCHDNLCIYDALALATGASKANDSVILQRAKIGYAVLLTSQGTAFLHAGDEMFRSKETTAAAGSANTKSGAGRTFVDNSYNASDAINMVSWSKVYAGNPITGNFSNYAPAQNGYQLYAYTQGLIALRKSSNAFRLPDAAVAGNLTQLAATGANASTLAFGYKAVSTDGTGSYWVFHNASMVPQSFTVGASLNSAGLLVDGVSAGLTGISNSSTVSLDSGGLTVTLAPLSSAIFKN